MMRIFKRMMRVLFLKSPLLFRIYASYHRANKKNSLHNKFDGEKKTGRYDIQSLGELLYFLDNTDSKVYGREIVEGYAENVNKTILLVSHELSLTGAPIVLLHLAECLKRKGFQTIIICGLDGERFPDNATMAGIPVVYYPALQKTDEILRIRKLFSKIIVSTIVCAPVIDQLNETDSSVMWWIHEAGSCYSKEPAMEMPHKVADNIHIYTGGMYAKKMLISRFPRYRVKNLVYGVPDLTKASNSSDFHIDFPDKKIFALFGSVEYRKGQDILMNAIERLPERVRRECFFLFVGQNLDPEITNALSELNKKYPENVLYMNEIQFDDFCQLNRDIDFLICASRDDPMPVVVAESMSLGKPCICSEYTGLTTIINHYNSGYVFRHNSSSALARKIEEAFGSNKDDYEAMSGNARRAFECVFSEQVFEEKLNMCLEQMQK